MLNSLIPELPSAVPGRLACAAFPELRVLVQLGAGHLAGTLSFEDLMACGEGAGGGMPALIEEQQDPDRIFNIQFTSGTTGTPKGAALTHFNLVNSPSIEFFKPFPGFMAARD